MTTDGTPSIGPVAYFSMEIAIADALPSYSGGLGGLAGDHLRSAADLELPVVGVTLLYHDGYFRQHLDADGRQHESTVRWTPSDLLELGGHDHVVDPGAMHDMRSPDR